MQLLSTHFTVALSAAGNHAATTAATATANRASKRTAWYPAFSEKATWSSNG